MFAALSCPVYWELRQNIESERENEKEKERKMRRKQPSVHRLPFYIHVIAAHENISRFSMNKEITYFQLHYPNSEQPINHHINSKLPVCFVCRIISIFFLSLSVPLYGFSFRLVSHPPTYLY